MPNKSKGIYLSLIASIISGFSIFLNKYAVASFTDPLIFTTIKNTSVAIIILFLILLTGKINDIKKLSKNEMILLILIGILGGSIPFYLFFKGLSTIPAVNGAIIQKTLVIWVSILAFIFMKEKLSLKKLSIITFLFISNLLIGGFKGIKFSTGEFYVLLATLFWAIETILSKKILNKFNSKILIGARMGFGSIILIILCLYIKPQELHKLTLLRPESYIWIAITTCLLISYTYFWYEGLKHSPATTATTVLVGSTLITNLLTAIFVTHTFNLLLITQCVLILLGIYFLYKLEVRQNFNKGIFKYLD